LLPSSTEISTTKSAIKEEHDKHKENDALFSSSSYDSSSSPNSNITTITTTTTTKIPPSPTTTTTTTFTSSSTIPQGIDTCCPKPKVYLLIILPGAHTPPNQYLAIAKVLQQEARQANNNMHLVVAIGKNFIGTKISYLQQWILSSNDPRILVNLIQAKAEHVYQQHQQQQHQQCYYTQSRNNLLSIPNVLYDIHCQSSVFQDIFLWGHSMGGVAAIQAALPSKFKALILYGCSMSFMDCHFDLAKGKQLLSSYPKPVLTIIGERDGNVRFYKVAPEAHFLQESDTQIQAQCSRTSSSVIQRSTWLRKPVIVLQELNHMQMAAGILPQASINTGRVDFTSRESLSRAHTTIAQLVVDFMSIHSSNANSTASSSLSTLSSSLSPSSFPKNKQKKYGMHGTQPQTFTTTNTTTTSIAQDNSTRAQERILKLGKITMTAFLQPIVRLTEISYQTRFLCDIQRRILHITTGAKFHFIDEDDNNPEESNHEEHSTPDILPRWHIEPQDFVYSRPEWDAEGDQITVECVEQDPIAISVVRQVSKTLAFKGRSREKILFNQNKYQEIKDTASPTLMELNQQTFDRVLRQVVTPSQRRRYSQEGKKLLFGPDIFVERPPDWITTPISIVKHGDEDDRNRDVYYLWQSPYTTTPLSVPAPFGGAWYGKPLSPAQAYEWIVFDAFKPFSRTIVPHARRT